MNDLALKDDVDINAIAMAVARNALGMQLPPKELLSTLPIDGATFLALAKNEQFKKIVKRYKAELETDNEGIRLKSAIALEDSIPRLHRVIHDPDTPPNVVVQGVKQLSDMAGVNKKDDKPAGTGFQINIDLSGLKEAAAQVTATAITPAQAIEHDKG